MTKKTLKEFITAYNTNEGYDIDKETLFETFEEGYPVIAEQDRNERRWYFILGLVTEVNIDGEDRFFSWTQYSPKGEDANRDDCGWEVPDLDDLCEVYPHEVVKTVYK